MTATIKHIDESRLESDLAYRFEYMTEFMGFGAEDIKAIHDSAEHLAPLVGSLVDAVYDKLFTYDATKRHFVKRQSGYDGETPAGLDELEMDHAQIAFRKQHLTNYLVRLVTAPYDAKLVNYLDTVGKIHTPYAGSKEISVPLVQMDVLMGFVATALLSTVLGLPLDEAKKARTVLAFSKLLWLQNDLIVKWYAKEAA